MAPDLRPAGEQAAPGTPLGEPRGDVPTWALPLAKAFVEAANLNANRNEPANISVRERLSMRAGRLHQAREAERLVKNHKASSALTVKKLDTDEILDRRAAKKRDKKRKKKRRNKKGDSESRASRSRSSSSSSTGSDQPFRRASAAGVSRNRSTRDARETPHFVLIDTVFDILSVLPRAASEAIPTKSTIYRNLPCVFVAFFTQVLKPILLASGGARNEREARTLCEVLDLAVGGEVLPLIMVALMRLKAIQQSVQAEGGGWSAASNFEMIPPANATLTSERERANLARDQRDRAHHAQALRGLPATTRGLPPDRRGGGRRPDAA